MTAPQACGCRATVGGKAIVIASDGTGNVRASENPTNVARLVDALACHDPNRQLVYYDQGVGTTHQARKALEDECFEELRTPRYGQVRKARGTLFGYGLRDNVREMYQELAATHVAGDRVFLFGFSRGAFTVRALAGLLHQSGLPSTDSRDIDATNEHFAQAWERRAAPADVEAARPRHRTCRVHFLGLWDTVKSYGGLRPVKLRRLRHNPDVCHVRHALALDERRVWFKHTTWGLLDSDREKTRIRERLSDFAQQDIREVWFSGSHSDVGGGGKSSEATARIALRWMLGEATNVVWPIDLKSSARACFTGPDSAQPDIHGSWGIGWLALELLVPRLEIDNAPELPKRRPRLGPTGRRKPWLTTRNKAVAIHSSVPPDVDLKEARVDMVHTQEIRAS